MSKYVKRYYTDINGAERVLTYLEPVSGLVKWHKDLNPGTATRWVTEDGRSIIQIPDNAWDYLGIRFSDKVVAL